MSLWDDPRSSNLVGAYRGIYDPREDLLKLRNGNEDWLPLWENLHHQGDVDAASYFAVIALVDLRRDGLDLGWNGYALIATIEEAREGIANPSIPEWLTEAYDEAWQALLMFAIDDIKTATDPLTLRSIFSVIAFCRGDRRLGALLASLDDRDIEAYLAGDAWG